MPIALEAIQATAVQTERPFRVRTPLGDDALLLDHFDGEEAVSRPYVFTLDLLSADSAVDPERLLGKPASLSIRLAGGEERTVHGLVRRFEQLGTHERTTAYRAEVVPWLWFLSLGHDCRIFQRKSVREIVAEVFGQFPGAAFEDRCVGTYPKREYCVQYRETHLDFVSRLLEEEGIFYFFRHEPDRHVLVLADAPSAVRPAWGVSEASVRPAGGRWGDDRVLELRRAHVVQTGRVTLTSYDWLKPSTQLRSTMGERGDEVHDWAGLFLEHSEGDRYARTRLEEREARRQVLTGHSTFRGLQSGSRLEIRDHARADLNRAYHVLSVRHAGRNGSYAAEGGDDGDASYENDFEAIPAEAPYRPPRLTPRPAAYGTQSAVVVGKRGEEIWTDAHGRVKLQFHWDREGKRDENSSCWVRVSTAWAGKGWGQFSVPRIGQEVLVEFLDGDPDRPVVVGRVYNAEVPPPCDPGGRGGMVSGMRSKTHKGQGANWIEMDDNAGKELLDVNAQFDMHTTVGHDDTQTVANDRTIKVGAKHTETIEADTSITVSTGNYSIDVASGTAKVHVTGAVTEKFDATQATTVAQNISITSDGAAIALEAATEITLTVGSSSLVMKRDGTIALSGVTITVDGKTVDVTGEAAASVAVADQALKLDPGLAEVSGKMVKSAATAVNEITGATVKLN